MSIFAVHQNYVDNNNASGNDGKVYVTLGHRNNPLQHHPNHLPPRESSPYNNSSSEKESTSSSTTTFRTNHGMCGLCFYLCVSNGPAIWKGFRSFSCLPFSGTNENESSDTRRPRRTQQTGGITNNNHEFWGVSHSQTHNRPETVCMEHFVCGIQISINIPRRVTFALISINFCLMWCGSCGPWTMDPSLRRGLFLLVSFGKMNGAWCGTPIRPNMFRYCHLWPTKLACLLSSPDNTEPNRLVLSYFVYLFIVIAIAMAQRSASTTFFFLVNYPSNCWVRVGNVYGRCRWGHVGWARMMWSIRIHWQES